MKKTFAMFFLSVLLLTVFFGENFIYALSADDFLPPAEGGSREIVEEVEEEEDIIIAESARDGFNYANQQLRSVEQKFKSVEFPSGIGYIAAGSHSYRLHENYNATQLDKRMAYVLAYTKAKARLAIGLRGISGTGYDRLLKNLENLDTSNETVANISELYEEEIIQATEALLRGYVVYDVYDNTEEQTVYVTIATSPKTIAAVSNISGGLMQSSSLNEGVDYVLGQVTKSIVPPIGGRIVTVPDTGEIAIISYGSEIIRRHDDSDIEDRMLRAAQRAAEMRSRDAMIGMIEGDQTVWMGGMVTSQEFQVQEFEEIKDINDNVVEREILEDTQKSFVSVMKNTDAYQSFRSGQFPPGVNTKLYEDGYWVYAISVYLPSISDQVSDFYQNMQNGGSATDTVSEDYISGEDVQEGPGGEVTSPEDM